MVGVMASQQVRILYLLVDDMIRRVIFLFGCRRFSAVCLAADAAGARSSLAVRVSHPSVHLYRQVIVERRPSATCRCIAVQLRRTGSELGSDYRNRRLIAAETGGHGLTQPAGRLLCGATRRER